MNLDKANESAYRLESWTKTLLAHIQKDLPIARAILQGTDAVPPGATKESLAAAHLWEIERATRDLNEALKDLKKAIAA